MMRPRKHREASMGRTNLHRTAPAAQPEKAGTTGGKLGVFDTQWGAPRESVSGTWSMEHSSRIAIQGQTPATSGWMSRGPERRVLQGRGFRHEAPPRSVTAPPALLPPSRWLEPVDPAALHATVRGVVSDGGSLRTVMRRVRRELQRRTGGNVRQSLEQMDYSRKAGGLSYSDCMQRLEALGADLSAGEMAVLVCAADPDQSGRVDLAAVGRMVEQLGSEVVDESLRCHKAMPCFNTTETNWLAEERRASNALARVHPGFLVPGGPGTRSLPAPSLRLGGPSQHSILSRAALESKKVCSADHVTEAVSPTAGSSYYASPQERFDRTEDGRASVQTGDRERAAKKREFALKRLRQHEDRLDATCRARCESDLAHDRDRVASKRQHTVEWLSRVRPASYNQLRMQIESGQFDSETLPF